MASRLYASIWLSASARDVELRRIDRFESDFRIPGVIHGRRSAEYLNWRFLDCPIRVYHAFRFHRRGEVLGYCVFSQDKSSVQLADFVVEHADRACTRALVEHCRGLGVTHVLFRGVGLPLRGLGFLERKVYGDCTGMGLPDGSWYLTVCDSDSEFD